MKLVFAGTPAFASTALQALYDAGHQIMLVLTQPDRPAGRGLKLQASAVKQLALKLGLPVLQPRSLRLDGTYSADALAAQAALLQAAPQAMVVAAYGLILPPWALALPSFSQGLGCINIHGSLLPRWRGAAPIHRAIEAGDTTTGITIMQMDAGLDTGPMLLHQALAIEPADTTASLHDRMAALGAQLVVQALDGRVLQPTAQPEAGVTYAHKISKTEAAIDWALPADVIERRLRAFDPFPGCTADLAGQPLKLWRGQVVAGVGLPGQLLPAPAGELVVACGQGALQVLELQLPGGKRGPASGWVLRSRG
jgi:methionyl-tRNA formyltransferase